MSEDGIEVTGEDFEGRPCSYCGETIDFAEWQRDPDAAVTWDIQIGDPETGETDDAVARHYFCSQECKRAAQRDEDWIRGDAEHGEPDRIREEDLDDDTLIADGGREESEQRDKHDLGVVCDVEDCDNRIVGLDDGWEMSRGTVCQDCIDYESRHGHWPDEDPDICVECQIDDGAIAHDCEEFSGGRVILQPGDTCRYCAFEAAATDGGKTAEDGQGDKHTDEDLLDWWECAECGESGNSGVRACPSCGGMQIGLHTDDVDLPPCWTEDSRTAVPDALRLWVHVDGPGFIGLRADDTVELVRADLRVGEDPDPDSRPATAENVRELAETYNDEWFGDSPQAGGADA